MKKIRRKDFCGVTAPILTASELGLGQDHKKEVSTHAFAQSVRVLLQNWRQGTVSCKTRAEVSGSNKKPWKQKGTGRARAGARTSPLWRGGGIIFGPEMRTRTLKISKKTKKVVANNLLWDFIENKKIFVLDWAPAQDKPKTNDAYKALVGVGLHDMPVNVFVTPHDMMTVLSFANISTVRVVSYDAPNAYTLADARAWVVLKRDVDAFKEMVAQWI